MTCDRCFQSVHDDTEHGVGLCPYEPRPVQYAVRQDTIEGGILIEHGLCNPDGSPRRFDSRSEIKTACAVKGVIPWVDVFEESRTKDARVHADWLQSSEAKRAKQLRDEARRERNLERVRASLQR